MIKCCLHKYGDIMKYRQIMSFLVVSLTILSGMTVFSLTDDVRGGEVQNTHGGISIDFTDSESMSAAEQALGGSAECYVDGDVNVLKLEGVNFVTDSRDRYAILISEGGGRDVEIRVVGENTVFSDLSDTACDMFFLLNFGCDTNLTIKGTGEESVLNLYLYADGDDGRVGGSTFITCSANSPGASLKLESVKINISTSYDDGTGIKESVFNSSFLNGIFVSTSWNGDRSFIMDDSTLKIFLGGISSGVTLATGIEIGGQTSASTNSITDSVIDIDMSPTETSCGKMCGMTFGVNANVSGSSIDINLATQNQADKESIGLQINPSNMGGTGAFENTSVRVVSDIAIETEENSGACILTMDTSVLDLTVSNTGLYYGSTWLTLKIVFDDMSTLVTRTTDVTVPIKGAAPINDPQYFEFKDTDGNDCTQIMRGLDGKLKIVSLAEYMTTTTLDSVISKNACHAIKYVDGIEFYCDQSVFTGEYTLLNLMFDPPEEGAEFLGWTNADTGELLDENAVIQLTTDDLACITFVATWGEPPSAPADNGVAVVAAIIATMFTSIVAIALVLIGKR